MSKKSEYINEIIKRLFEYYKTSDCTLDYTNPLQLLIATQLAAQCTDARVNIVMKDLVIKYPDVYAFASADINILENDIKSTGFYKNKAKNIIGTCKMLVSDFNGEVPSNMEDLLKLPGVGRKTANLVLGEIFHIPGIVVDTHAGRLSRRFGFTKNTDPQKVEYDLLKIIPKELQTGFCHRLVDHGRKFCKSQKPNCEECFLNDICKKIIK